ncbi:MAG: hypothetical protein A7315_08760 [Candidatus Altiarchaeales archaeon WOR_SM1_79]|nr:MAG: hypothetical protein A7315_08760 [Candidatus Altiarchaeales archaeon WOR_SM1_79]
MNGKIGEFQLNKVYCMDCVKGMKKLPENSIDFMVASPPYDNIREYKGFEVDLSKVGKELFRVIKDGGVVVMVMQDATKDFAKTLTTFRMIIDWVDNAGFRLFECLIYAKHGAPGAWWNSRFRVDHEYMPVFLKGKRPAYFNKELLKLDAKHAGKTMIGCATRLTNGKTLDSRPIHIKEKKCRGTLWEYKTCGDGSRLKHKHPATYPDQLPVDFIECFCPPGGIVLDPFMGSGTTAIAARKLGRNFIGFDISEEYCELAEQRLKEEVEEDENQVKITKF